MKKLFFLVSLATIIFLGCKKDNNTLVPPKAKTLVANAGLDTAINLPLKGTGWDFKAILNGKASHALSGQIVFYSWTEIDGDPLFFHIKSPNADSTEVILEEWPDFQKPSGITHKFRLEVRDDHQNVDYDTVAITIFRKFLAEYEGLSWDSTVGSLTYLNIKYKPNEIINYQAFDPIYTYTPDVLNLCTFNGNCIEVGSWKTIPYVPYDSIKLTDKDFFYSTNNNNSLDIFSDNDWPVIYATQKSGIDFTQKLSIGVWRLK